MFLVPENLDLAGDPFRWPLLGVSPDRHSVGVCAINYLQRKLRANIDEVYDMSHGAWDDEKLAIKDSGLMSWLMLMLVTVNVFDGPWKNNGRWNESCGAMKALWQTRDPRNVPLFVSMLPRILEEIDEAGHSIPHGVDPIDFAWNKIMEDGPLARKGYRCNLNRFYGFIEVGITDTPVFWQRYFVYLYTSLESDYLRGVRITPQLRSRPAEMSTGSTSNVITAAEEKALRDSCGNAYGIATLMHSDPVNKKIYRILISTGRHNKKWQGLMNQALRSSTAFAPWAIQQLTGADNSLTRAMSNILQTMQREGELDYMGFVLPRHADPRNFEPGEIEHENTMARLLAHHALRLVAYRLRRELWLVRGWPTTAVLFLSEHAEDRNFAMTRLQADHAVVDALKAAVAADTPAGLKAFLDRSVFELVPVQQLWEIARREGFRVTPEFRDWLEARFNKIAQSQAAEDGFNVMKNAPVKALHRTGRPQYHYKKLLDSNVLEVKHDYIDVGYDSSTLGRGVVLNNDHFEPAIENLSIKTQDLVSYSPKTTWYSPQAIALSAPHGDLCVLEEAVTNDHLDRMKHLWLGGVMHPHHNMIVRRGEPDQDGAWYFPLVPVEDKCGVLFWPAERVPSPPGRDDLVFWRPATDASAWSLLPVWDLSEWRAIRIAWKSPLSNHLRHKTTRRSWGSWAVSAEQCGGEGSLLEIAAGQAFWSLPQAFVHKIAAHGGVDFIPSTCAFNEIFSIVLNILKCNEETALMIMQQRFGSEGHGGGSSLDDILMLEEAIQCLDKNDEAEVRECKDKRARHAEAKEVMRVAYLQKHREVYPKPVEPPAKKKKGGGKGAGAAPPGPPRLQLNFDQELTTRSLKPLRPPVGYLWRANGLDAQAWRTNYFPFGERSFAWSLYGQRYGAVLALQFLWRSHLTATGGTCPDDCPVENLFNITHEMAENGQTALPHGGAALPDPP